ncbi:MAG: sigma 54-interacting transcriptional regulator, partial [Myxococcales bacterium]|nr:sigma 54-interacting transcriptional regulator [Myxococcales bacterium]
MPESTLQVEVLRGAQAGTTAAVRLPGSVGRAPDGGLHLADEHLSRVHGRFERSGGVVRYVDQGSSNGSMHVRGSVRTLLAGAESVAELWTGDELWLGDPATPVVLRVTVPQDSTAAVLARREIAEVARFADRVTAEPGRLAALYRHMRALGQCTDLDAVLEVAAGLVFDLLPKATHVAVALAERAGRFPVVYANDRQGGRPAIAVSRTMVQTVVAERAGLLFTDAASQLAQAGSVVQAGLASTLAVPLWTGNDVRGVLQVDNRDARGVFDASDLEALTVAAGPISFAAENARLLARLRLAELRLARENAYLKAKEQAATFNGIIGDSDAIAQVLDAVGKVRDTRVPVLIQGETGTGKSLFARRIHNASSRADKPFFTIDCGALSENLLESELFG